MKNKVVIAVLALACIVSVGFNIYQYKQLNISQSDLSETMAQIDDIIGRYTELQAQIESMQQELDSLNGGIKEKQEEADSLAKENESLKDNISELEKSIVAIVEDDEEDEADEADKTDKAETTSTTSTQTTETASTTNTASNQNVDAATQAEVLEKAAANGFGFSNGTDGMNIVEVDNNAGMSDWTISSGNWE